MAQSFGEGWAIGLQIGGLMNQRRLEQSIDEAGKSVKEEMQKEKELRTQQDQAQQELFANSNKAIKTTETPSTYQQGDSLGLQGYQTGNKPIQTTVPTAPAGYGTREDGTTTDQTLIGNYGTTASFKGEKPTAEDTRMMQKDTQRPFNGPQDNNILDLAQVPGTKAEADIKEAAKPKVLDTLNEQTTAAIRAKDAYDYNTRVIQKLQQSGNARAALEFGSKVATSELTLAQADHTKFTTVAALSKRVGDMASNALESMQQPGADINKIFYDTMASAKNDFGYTGKVPFSMDPRENIKTLQMLEKNSGSVLEKAELGIKQTVASQKSVMDNAELAIKQDKLTLDKIGTGLAINKENREAATASFNRLAENVKIQFQALNSINSVMNEDYKKALKPSYDANLKALQGYAKALNVPMPNIAVGTPGNTLPGVKPMPGAAPTPAAVNPSPNTQPVNNAFPADVLKDAGVANEAGGYVNPTPAAKTTTEVTKETTAKANKIKELKNKISKLQPVTITSTTIKPLANPFEDVLTLGKKAVSSIEFNPYEAARKSGQKERDRKAKELKKLQDELDALTKS